MKSIKHVFLLVIIAFFVAASAHADGLPTVRIAETDSAVKHVDGKGAAALIKENKDVIVLDIRTPKEYAGGHIAGAKNIDFYADDFGKQLAQLDKSKTYLVHCASGGRSTKSLEQFQALHFKSVIHLDGGFKAWEKAGNPVEH